jgi:tetratricopeptide (TPR) repeat protein
MPKILLILIPLFLLFAAGCSKAPVKQEESVKLELVKLESTESEPDSLEVYYAMAFAHVHKQDYDKADEFFQKISMLKPDYADIYAGMGDVYLYVRRDYDKAIEYYMKVIELKPDFAEIYHDIGKAYEAKGDKEKELEYKDKAHELGYELK